MVQSTLRQKAINLRLRGKSYGEILKELNLTSKGTLSYWFSNLRLPPHAQRRLVDKIALARKKGLLAFNTRRTRRIVIENNRIFKDAIKNTPVISKEQLLLIGAALYWGEGTLRSRERGYPTVSFSNSDPNMVRVFMWYLRKGLGVVDTQIKSGIHIHPNIKAEKAKRFWSKITKLPKGTFFITEQISRASKFKRKGNFLPYGTLSIRVNRRQPFYRIKGYITGIIKQVEN